MIMQDKQQESLIQLEELFAKALKDVVAIVAGMSFERAYTVNESLGDELVGMMSLQGQKVSLLAITCSLQGVRLLCSHMLGVHEDEITDRDMGDAICELVNMTAGSVKARLRETAYEYTLTTPFAMKGKGLQFIVKDRVSVVQVVLSSGEIELKLKMIM